MQRILAAAVLLAWAAVAGAATYHGVLAAYPTRGRIDTTTGAADVRTGWWEFKLAANSNGIDPAHEGVWVFLGDTERYRVEPEALVVTKHGKRFRYRNAGATRGIRALDLRATRHGTWVIRLRFVGVDLSSLLLTCSVCQPMAVIVGDDDAFDGALLTRRGCPANPGRRLAYADQCSPGDWPWL
jgi:hypothetical protein